MKFSLFKVFILAIIVFCTIVESRKRKTLLKSNSESKSNNQTKGFETVKMLIFGDNGQIKQFYETTGGFSRNQTKESEEAIQKYKYIFKSDDKDFSCTVKYNDGTTDIEKNLVLDGTNDATYEGMENFKLVLDKVENTGINEVAILGDIIYPENKFGTRVITVENGKRLETGEFFELNDKVEKLNEYLSKVGKKNENKANYSLLDQLLIASTIERKLNIYGKNPKQDQRKFVVINKAVEDLWRRRVLCGFEILFNLLQKKDYIDQATSTYKNNFFILGGNHAFDVSAKIMSVIQDDKQTITTSCEGGRVCPKKMEFKPIKPNEAHEENINPTGEKTFGQVNAFTGEGKPTSVEYIDLTALEEEQNGNLADSFLLKPRLIKYDKNVASLDINSTLLSCVFYAQYKYIEKDDEILNVLKGTDLTPIPLLKDQKEEYYACLGRKFIPVFATVSYTVALEYTRRVFQGVSKLDADNWNIIRSHHTPTNHEDFDEYVYFHPIKYWKLDDKKTEIKEEKETVDNKEKTKLTLENFSENNLESKVFMDEIRARKVHIWLASHNHSSSYFVYDYEHGNTKLRPIFSTKAFTKKRDEDKAASNVNTDKTNTSLTHWKLKLESDNLQVVAGNKNVAYQDSYKFTSTAKAEDTPTLLHIFITGSSGRYFDSVTSDLLTKGSLLWARAMGDYTDIKKRTGANNWNWGWSTYEFSADKAIVNFFEIDQNSSQKVVNTATITIGKNLTSDPLYGKLNARKEEQLKKLTGTGTGNKRLIKKKKY